MVRGKTYKVNHVPEFSGAFPPSSTRAFNLFKAHLSARAYFSPYMCNPNQSLAKFGVTSMSPIDQRHLVANFPMQPIFRMIAAQ